MLYVKPSRPRCGLLGVLVFLPPPMRELLLSGVSGPLVRHDIFDPLFPGGGFFPPFFILDGEWLAIPLVSFPSLKISFLRDGYFPMTSKILFRPFFPPPFWISASSHQVFLSPSPLFLHPCPSSCFFDRWALVREGSVGTSMEAKLSSLFSSALRPDRCSFSSEYDSFSVCGGTPHFFSCVPCHFCPRHWQADVGPPQKKNGARRTRSMTQTIRFSFSALRNVCADAPCLPVRMPALDFSFAEEFCGIEIRMFSLRALS